LFNNFIQEVDLHDLKMGGFRYTYFQTAGGKLSKLDRILVCSKFLDVFPLASSTALARELSDHCPIILSSSNLDFGPIPFKLFNSWMLRDGFDAVVRDAWSNFVGYGAADSYLACKLRFLKGKIRGWRLVESQKEKAELNSLKDTMQHLDTVAESRPLNDLELSNRLLSSKRIAELEKLNAMDMQQKARIKWAVDGDENTKLFHGYVNNRNKKSHLHGLTIDGNWSSDPVAIKQKVFDFFSAKYKEKWKARPAFKSDGFRQISSSDQEFLELPISLGEIKSAIWACGNDKSPGPDGFSFKFMKRHWVILKQDILAFVKHFEQWGRFSDGCNSSSISLVAKVKDPLNLGDYRPISLIGSMYKIVAKILALRVKRVLGSCIGEVQSAYIEGRSILEGPLIVNELCSWTKSKGRKLLVFKADFNKAFDTVNWNFLDSMMEQMNFGVKWRSWIRGCLMSAKASVLVNGSPTKEFSMERGVRQGDPLSPFLFIIAMEGLNVAMTEATDNGIFHGVPFPNSELRLSHLFYADDALFVGEWSRLNIQNLARILRCFHVASGLSVNFKKSKVFGIGALPAEVANWATPLGCEPASKPFQYLGVPVGANMNLRSSWDPIIEKLKSKLSLWKSKMLSFGGKITLAKSVLGSLPSYYLSIFVAPMGVLESLEKIRRQFIWGGSDQKGGICWVTWEKITASKELGGLGLGSIRDLNLSLLAKW